MYIACFMKFVSVERRGQVLIWSSQWHSI